MKTKVVKPLEGKRVFDVIDPRREVPPEGATVPWNSYWQRRVRDGGLVVVEQTKTSEPKKKPAAPKKTKVED